MPRAVRTGVYYEGEEPEEESATDDEMGEAEEPQPTELSNLMTNLRRLQNEAIANERYEDASDLQCSILACLNAIRDSTGLNVVLITTDQKLFPETFQEEQKSRQQ